jgi:hypothetical protein
MFSNRDQSAMFEFSAGLIHSTASYPVDSTSALCGLNQRDSRLYRGLNQHI